MVSPIDPNEIRMTGENSFIRLGEEEGGEQTTRSSHWRVLISPGGPGHALFLQSELTDNQVRVYTDNVAAARWLQGEIESFEPFVIRSSPGSTPGRVHGVYSVFVPALSAQLDINGKVARGRAFAQERDGQPSSTCCLAWSETWVRPR